MKPYVSDPDLDLYVGDAIDVLRSLPTASIDACVTSPPYLDMRSEYPSPSLGQFWDIFCELRRVVVGPALVNVGRLWRGSTEQLWWVDLLTQTRLAGWQLIDTLIWSKPNANPIQGNVFTNAHEYVFCLGEPGVTFFNVDAIRTAYSPEAIARYGRKWFAGGVKGDKRPDRRADIPIVPNELGARPRSVVEFTVGKEKGNPHPAPMPLGLAEHLVALATRPGDTVIDPFGGSGTTGRAARRLERKSVLIELDPKFARMAADGLSQQSLLADGEAA